MIQVYGGRKRTAEQIEKERTRMREYYRKRRADKTWPAYDRARRMKWQYGLTVEQIAEMAGERCRICGREYLGVPVVDHDHETKRVRGVICRRCNAALGLMGDNPVLVRSLANYIEKGA